jgi:hypothetical protein
MNGLKNNLLYHWTSVICGDTLTFVRGADFHSFLALAICALSLLVVLDNGLGRGVVDLKLLCDLKNKIESYIDDAPPFLNGLEKFFPHLLSHFFVPLTGKVVLDVHGNDLIADKLDLLLFLKNTRD